MGNSGLQFFQAIRGLHKPRDMVHDSPQWGGTGGFGMTEAESESLQLDSFKLEVGDINTVELDRLHALSISVSWPHRAEDWQFLRDFGKGIVALDEIGRILGSAMWFPYGPDFATVGMVITSPRLQANGTGKWLMSRVLDQMKGRNLGLSATRAARRLYQSLNFQKEATVYQCNGEAVYPPEVALPPDITLRSIEPADFDQIAALDAAAFGADRTALLAKLMTVSKGVALIRDGAIEAFALCRAFGRGHVVGPVVARSQADAIAVVRPHAAEHAGRFLRLDTREKDGVFPEFLSRCGLPVFDTVTTMSLGRPWPVSPDNAPAHMPRTYGLVSQALG
jgi:GNAT superfamily N-acetyltransferase